MDFFKSVFSDPTPDPSPPPTSTAPPNPETTPPPLPPTSSWPFGSTLFKTLASKSESLIDNYYKDLQDFSIGLKKETSVIHQAASRAVQDLPDRLESGATIAQESLEAVGQAIDNVGSTVFEIIGKDLNIASNDSDDNNSGSSDNRYMDLNPVGSSKPYSRIEAMIRGLQCDITTYCDEVGENAYEGWKLGFRVGEKREEIDRLVEENGKIKEIYNEIVPVKVDDGTFWCRYFYRADKLVKAEEARARIVKKAILGEDEEELRWDFDDDDENGEHKSNDELKKDGKGKGKGITRPQVETPENEEGKRDNEGEENLGGKVICNEKEMSDGEIGSDVWVISSQRSSHAEDDLGWDEIEDIGSGDESKVSNGIDLHTLLSSAEEEEEMTWDIEDDDDEPVKS